jgi:hypothetical protein
LSETENEGFTQFKDELLQHLAGSIVVKEHRLRYQQEQYLRFFHSKSLPALSNRKETLEEFATNYAKFISFWVDLSHNNSCP